MAVCDKESKNLITLECLCLSLPPSGPLQVLLGNLSWGPMSRRPAGAHVGCWLPLPGPRGSQRLGPHPCPPVEAVATCAGRGGWRRWSPCSNSQRFSYLQPKLSFSIRSLLWLLRVSKAETKPRAPAPWIISFTHHARQIEAVLSLPHATVGKLRLGRAKY